MNFSKLILSYYLVGFWNFNSEPLKREFIFKNEEKFIFLLPLVRVYYKILKFKFYKNKIAIINV